MVFYCYANQKLERLHETKGIATGSLGLYYMKITELCGFDWLKGEEWKVMGLAPYGKLDQELYDALNGIITVNGFDCKHPSGQLFQSLAKLDSFKQRHTGSMERAADCGYTGQVFFADRVTELLQHLSAVTQSDNLAFAGGCALNSSFNGQITGRTDFKQVHIPSAPADDGCALGTAWLAYRANHGNSGKPPKLLTPYTGSSIAKVP